jgi:hypothetical protein
MATPRKHGSRNKKIRDLAGLLADTRDTRARLRHELARTARPGEHGPVLPERLRWAGTLWRAQSSRLEPGFRSVGSALGFKVKDGAFTDTRSLTVFVRRKRTPGQLKQSGVRKLPRQVSSKRRQLAVDVVELGQLQRQVQLGDSLGRLVPRSKGTLAALARDMDTGAIGALTAMHVTGLREFPAPGSGSPLLVTPSPFDAAGGRRLGALRRGTTRGVDAALLSLEAAVTNQLPFIGPIAGWRPTTYPADVGIGVWMVGATSGLQAGIIQYPHADVPGDQLSEVILVRIRSDLGDSGALLVDQNRFALGLLVGAYGNGLRAYSSIALAQALLRCSLLTS